MSFINFNGEIHQDTEPLLTVGNRSFMYGDGFFETMAYMNGSLLLYQWHEARIKRSFKMLMAHAATLKVVSDLPYLVKQLADKNRYVNARVRVQFYRMGEGWYTPQSSQFGYVITMQPLPHASFTTAPVNKVGVYPEYKPNATFGTIKSASSLYYVMAGNWARLHHFDDLIICTEQGNSKWVCEAVSSSIMVAKHDALLYPSSQLGQVHGVLHQTVLDLLSEQFKLVESYISADELNTANEVLLLNAVRGVRYVVNMNGRTLTGTMANRLNEALNSALGLI